MARHLRILAIMKTGRGKSMFFMLLVASSRGRVTVIIVLLNALRDNLINRCKAANIASAS